MDDQERLSAHMMKSSAMMAGGKMHFDFDDAKGRAVGSVIRMSGEMLGMTLDVSERVVEREPPHRKVWETIGEPRLLVVGNYRLGFEIEAHGQCSRLTMFIDYDDPPPPWRIAGRLLGAVYARWCTTSMADGAVAAFARDGLPAAQPA